MCAEDAGTTAECLRNGDSQHQSASFFFSIASTLLNPIGMLPCMYVLAGLRRNVTLTNLQSTRRFTGGKDEDEDEDETERWRQEC